MSRMNSLNKRRVIVMSFVAVLAGCKAPDPAKELDSTLSWVATAGLAAQAWLNHTTPESYTRQTLELSRSTLEEQLDPLLKAIADEPPSEKTASAFRNSAPAISRLVRHASATIGRMAVLVTARDAPSLQKELTSLRADESSLKSIADSAGGGQ